MNIDISLKTAKDKLFLNGLTLVLCDGNDIITSNKRGVAPLLDLVHSNFDYSEYCAADRVIGKAAALLYVLLKIKNIYCAVASEAAINVFKQNGISVSCDCVVPAIKNRDKTGFCPMETAVLEINEPHIALKTIEQKLLQLQKQK